MVTVLDHDGIELWGEAQVAIYATRSRIAPVMTISVWAGIHPAIYVISFPHHDKHMDSGTLEYFILRLHDLHAP